MGNINTMILHESKHWLAIHKPSGMIVEKNPFEKPSVEDLVWDYLVAQEKKPYLGIVHRLDRVTSGVLLMAKRKSALRHLNRQFAERSVSKTYLAILAKAPPEPEGKLENWLLKDQKNKRALILTTKQEKAQWASLNYEVTQENKGLFLTKVLPQTGRFHQIRAQFAAVGCPILGDEKYGSLIDPTRRHIALHAVSLDFINPETEERMNLVAPMPEEKWWLNFK